MYQDNIFRELVVDNFAGGGGASTGMELALGYPVDIAVNHDADAIAMHKVNHPYTRHFREDVFAIDPEQVTGGRAVGIAWFSPDCKHFSRAKGGKPVDKKIRGLSWVVLKWAMHPTASPRIIMMENVEEIQTWGPLIEVDGKMRPDPSRSGETFNGFIAMLTTGIDKSHPAFSEACEFLKIGPNSEEGDRLAAGLDYKVEWRMLKARELMLAQGFPPDYIIDIEPYIGKKYSEAKQVARLGNAVCPPVAEALVRANCAEIASQRIMATMAKLNAVIDESCYRKRQYRRAAQ